MTGDAKYAHTALIDLYAVTAHQAYYVCQLDNPAFVRNQATIVSRISGRSCKAKMRVLAVANFPEFSSNMNSLWFASWISIFVFTGPCYDKRIQTVKRKSFLNSLTDKAMIEAYAAYLINYVYWLKQLGNADYRNVLVIMLLNWQEALHPKPFLVKLRNTKGQLPKLVTLRKCLRR